MELKNLVTVFRNILLAYGIFMACRLLFLFENWSLFATAWSQTHYGQLLAGCLLFDTSAIVYTLAIYVLLMLLPVGLRYRRGWQRLCRWYFVVVMALSVIANLVDAVYSQYSGRRTTSSFFSEFGNDNNLGGIVGIELLRHWYLVLAAIVLIGLTWILYRESKVAAPKEGEKLRRYLAASGILVAIVPLCMIGMRGGATYHRPLSVADASRFVAQPQQVNLVLNTPFSMFRTIGKTTFKNPAYFADEQLDSYFSPIHNTAWTADSGAAMTRRNVVVFIVESFGMEYVGYYNRDKEGYGADTPFLDSLIENSLTFTQSFANGRKSIDAMPSVLSSIPMFVEPYVLTRYSGNAVGSLASLLDAEGYRTAFFHGADNGSMGFMAYANAVGFQQYYGLNEYCADPRHRGMDDFDGNWAIWDEEFLQYFDEMLDTLPQPFFTALFTATSHHPFNVPPRYRDSKQSDKHPVYACVRYVDHAFRRFFEEAQKQPWYDNTIFVFTADHTNATLHDFYKTPLGLYRVPIIIYDPSGRSPRGTRNTIAQQIDIMPTLLGLLGYHKPYLAFGKDLLAIPADSSWAIHYNNGVYQYVCDSSLIMFDGNRVVAHYNYLADPLLQNDVKDRKPVAERHVNHMKALIQSYMQRMAENRLTE